MLISIARFWHNGWIYDFYISPEVHFPYYGFEWVRPLGAVGMYAIFGVMVLSAAGIMIGFFYRLSAILFFLTFTYVELIDKTYYLNHYYFVSIVGLLLCLVPANRSFSLDSMRKPSFRLSRVPAWTVNIFRLQLAIVYVYAGIAKLNPEWLLDAMPLRIWLPAQNHLPLVGGVLSETWAAYALSWMGALYDLSVVFFLMNRRTRPWAYGAVILFHMITWLLFPIGMFPFIMILSTLIFFSESFHLRVIHFLRTQLDRLPLLRRETNPPEVVARAGSMQTPGLLSFAVALFMVIQILLPWRFVLYPGNLFWTEEGYRFSWRVMLIEKAGYVVYHVRDPDTGREGDVMPGDYLTPVQEKMLATQPDMILQFAHFLEEKFRSQGIRDPVVRAEAYVTLNGRGTTKFIDDNVDLTKKSDDFRHKDWIVSFEP